MSSLPPALLEAMQRIGGLLQSGDLRGAHDQLQAVVEAHPDYVEALRLLGGIRQNFGDTKGAEALLRKAMALDPGWAPTPAITHSLPPK